MSITPGGGGSLLPPPQAFDWDQAVEATTIRIQAARDPEGSSPSKTAQQGALLVWEAIYSHLRGRIPSPVPVDLMGVSVSAGLRIAKGLTEVGSIFLNQGQFAGQVEYRSWNGWLAIERMTLDRYRRRTA